MILALDRRMRRGSRGFTLIELVVVVIILSLLAGLCAVGYSTITGNVKRTQAKELLSSVAAAQQSWYRSRGAFVAFDNTNATDTTGADTNSSDGANSPTSTLGHAKTDQLLRRIAPGSADVPASYVDYNVAAAGFGQISIGTKVTNNVPQLFLTTMSKTKECFGQVVAPAGSSLPGFGPDAVSLALADCSATKLMDIKGGGPGDTSTTGKPNAPTNFKLTPAPGRVVLTWDASVSDGTNDPISYEISYADGTHIASVDAAALSYTDGSVTALDTTKQYSYKIWAHNGAGDSAPVTANPSSVAPLDPSATAPDRPTGLTATWNGTGVQLHWNPAGSGATSNAIGYEIRRDGHTIACLGRDVCAAKGMTGLDYLSTDYTDAMSTAGTTLQLGASYTYDLRALNQVANGQSSWSSTSFTTPPASPTSVSATPLAGIGDTNCANPACVRVTWTAPAAPTGGVSVAPLLGYRIYRGTSPTFDPYATPATGTQVGSVDADTTTYYDKSLTGASTYYYKVAAYNRNTVASTNLSSAASATTVAAAPTVTGTSPAPSKIVLTWTAPSAPGAITGYNVYRLDDNNNPVYLARVTTTSYTDTGADLPSGALDGLSAYTYRVAAVTAAGVGVPSAGTTVMSAAAPVRNVTVTATATSATLTWKRSAGVNYTIKRNAASWNTTVGTFTETGLSPGVSYTYTISSSATDPTTGQPVTVTSDPIIAITAPDIPSNLTATPSGTTVALAWTAPNPATNVTAYRIYRCAGSACDPTGTAASKVGEVTGTVTTFSDTGLSVATSYSYAVSAVTAGGEGARSGAVSTATIPTKVTATATGGTAPQSIKLTWTASSVATSYDVLRNGVWLTSVPATQLAFTDGSVVGGVSYSYVIRAKNSAGYADANAVSAISPPDPPSGLTANPGAVKVTLSWLSQGADAFQLLRCAGQNCDPAGAGTVVATITPGSTAGYVDTGLSAQAWYTYAIRAGRLNTGGVTYTWSQPSAPVTTKTVLDPPTNLSVGTVTNTSVALSWAASPGATQYRVYRDGVAVSTQAGTSYTDAGLVPGTRYTYVVTAVAANGEESGASGSATAITGLSAPAGVAVFGSTTTTVTLNWTTAAGATSYEILGCAVPCSNPVSYGVTADGTITSFQVTGLAPNTEYDLFVRSRTAVVTSNDSNHVDAWTVPVAPAAPAVTATTTNTASLSWATTPNALSYSVLRDGTKVATVAAPTTSFTDGTNMLPADFANGGESTGTGAAAGSGGGNTATSTTAAAHGGSSRGYAIAVPANIGQYATVMGTTLTGRIEAGKQYTYSAWLAKPAGQGAVNVQFALAWRRVDGSTITYSATPAQLTADTWSRYTVTGTAPADAASVVAYAQTLTTSTNTPVPVATTVYVDDQQFEQGPAVTSWNPGGLDPGTTHTYAVVVTNRGGDSAASPTTSAQLRPSAPLPSTTGGYRTVTLSWPQVSSATTYKVYRCASAGCDPTATAAIATVTEPTRSYTDGALADNSTYYYAVTATNNAGVGIASVTVSRLTTPATAAAPTFSNVTNSSMTVSWASVAGATSYQLYRDGVLINTGAGTTFADTALAPGASYSYTVSTGNATGYSPVGPAGTMTTLPATVTNLTVASITSTTATLTWTAPAGSITGYKLTLNGAATATIGANATYTFTGLTPSTAYTFGVSATTTGGTGTEATTTGTTRPAAPLNLTATPGPQGTINLSWNAVAGANSYTVYRNNGASSAACTTTTATSCADTGLTDATAYTYYVVATNVAGDSDKSTQVTATTVAAAPTGLSATPSGTSVTLTWTAPTGAVTGYKVYRCTGTGCATTYLGTAAGTSFTDTGLATGTTYTYQVTATTAGGGESAKSAAATATTVPVAPTGLSAVGGVGKVTLTWTASAGASGYTLYRCTGTGCAPVTLTTTTGTSYTDTTVAGGSTYTYTVAATNTAGTSAQSATAAALTAPAAPGKPTAAPSTTSVALNWTSPGGTVTGFKVYRDGILVTTIPSAATTSYTDTGLNPNSSYSYTVTAYNATGEGPASPATAVTTTVAVPTGLTVTGTTGTTVTLSWTAVGGATGYKIYTGGANPVSVTGTSGTVSGLNPGVTYSFTVTALGTGSESAPSAPVSATTNLAAPTGITAAGGIGKVTLSWTPVGGATGYYVYRCTGTCTPTTAQQVGTVTTGTSFTDTGLADGETYSYTLATYNATVTSPTSAPVTTITVPPTPTGVAGTAPSSTSINLSWTASKSATGYKVYNGATVVWSGPGTSATITGLNPATSYTYTVTATNASGESAASTPVTLMTRPDAATLTLSTGYRQIAASWTAVSSATSYTLYYCAGTSCTPTTVAYTGAATSYTLTGLADNATYRFAIGAANGSGETQSAVTGATTLPAVPANFRWTSTTDTTVDLAWSTSAGAAGYKIYRGGVLVATLGSAATSWTDTGLAANTTYSYTIASGNAVGVYGPLSAAVSASTRPAVVTGLAFGTPTDTSATATWTASPAGTTYKVYSCVSAQGGGCTPNMVTATTSTTATSYTFSGVTSSTQVCLAVTVVSSSTGLESTPTATVCRTTAPAAPTGVSVSTFTTGGWTTSWTASAGAPAGTTYEVQVTNVSNGSVAIGCTTTGTSCAQGGRWPGTDYQVRVHAVDATGTASTWAGPVIAAALPVAVTLTGSITGVTASLSWTNPASSNVNVTYVIYRDGVQVATTAGTTATVTVPGKGTSYAFTVKAQNSLGALGAASNTVTLTSVPGDETVAPTVAENVAGNGFTITCAAMPAATAYYFYRNGAYIGQSGTTALSDTSGFVGGTTYAFSCAALNGSGVGGQSPANSVRPSYKMSVINGDNPALYYKLNENPAATGYTGGARDSSGNGRNGDYSANSGAAYGGAGAFPSATDGSVTFAAPTGTAGTTYPGVKYNGAGIPLGAADRTYEFWSKQSSMCATCAWLGQGTGSTTTPAGVWLGNQGSNVSWAATNYTEDSTWLPVSDWGSVAANTRGAWPGTGFADQSAHTVWWRGFTSSEYIGWQDFRRTFVTSNTVTATVYAVGDDRVNVWVDGTQVIAAPIDGSGSVNTQYSATVTLQPGQHAIAVGVVNGTKGLDLNASGFAVSLMANGAPVLDARDNSPVHTDSTWKYWSGKTPAIGWSNPDYWDRTDGGWANSYWTAPKDWGQYNSGVNPWGLTYPTSDGTTAGTQWPYGAADWIWAAGSVKGSVPAGDVYFRYTMYAQAAKTFTIVWTVDDSGSLYVDGTLIGSKSSTWQKYRTDTVSLGVGNHTIAFKGTNAAVGNAGLLWHLENSAGSDVSNSAGGFTSGYQTTVPATSLNETVPPAAPQHDVVGVGDGWSETSYLYAPGITDGTWHLMDLVISGGGKTQSLYTDGKLTASDTRTTAFNTAAGPLELNGLPWSSWSGMPGSMDEFALYPTALTAAQVAAHYAASR